jgi:methylmalonyl-CoA/ethylmalonyl-CoA epimerase
MTRGDLLRTGLPASLAANYDHVAVATRRIRDVLPLYADLLGGTFYWGGDNARTGFRALQLALANGSRIEILEPLPGSTFLDRFLERTGGGGLHHVTCKVPGIHAAIAAAEQAGYTPVSPFLDDPEWQEVFLHPKETGGVLIQLVQAPPSGQAEGSIEEVLAGHGHNGTGIPS